MSKGKVWTMALIVSAAIAAIAWAASVQSGAGLKVAVVDVQAVFDKYLGTAAAQAKLEEEIRKLEEEGKKKSEELRALQEKYDKQRIFIDDKRKEQEMIQQIERKRQEIQQFIEEGRAKLETRRRELSEPIVKEIDVMIQRIATREGIDLVFEKSALLYFRPELDITNAVIKELNEKYLKEHPQKEEGQGSK